MADEVLKRTLPHSPDAERSVIGAMMLNRDAIETAGEYITGNDFYNRQLGIYFDAIRELAQTGQEVDLVTLQERLKTKNLPPEYTKPEYIAELISGVYTSTGIKSHARIVQETSIRRKLIAVTESLEQDCYGGAKELDALLDEAEKNIFDITQRMNRGDYTPIRSIVVEGLNRIAEISKRGGHVTGISTGFRDLDYNTAGFQPSDLVLIAARPSMGKTALALTLASHIAFRENKSVVIFSLEMPKEQLINRLFSMVSHIDMQKIRTGKLTDHDWSQLVESGSVIGASNLIIDDTSGLSVPEMRSKCRKYKAEKGLDIVFVDYLQLMSGGRERGGDSRQQEISDISRGLKSLARELNVPVIALSQLSRAVEQRTDHRPMLSDLRESGAIEQDADVVMFLYREEYYNRDTERKGVTELIIAKQRNGPLGVQELGFRAENARFVATTG